MGVFKFTKRSIQHAICYIILSTTVSQLCHFKFMVSFLKDPLRYLLKVNLYDINIPWEIYMDMHFPSFLNYSNTNFTTYHSFTVIFGYTLRNFFFNIYIFYFIQFLKSSAFGFKKLNWVTIRFSSKWVKLIYFSN